MVCVDIHGSLLYAYNMVLCLIVSVLHNLICGSLFNV